MLIKVQGVWEAERIADILYSNAFVNTNMLPWVKDVVERIRKQVQKEKERRHGSKNNVRDN